jgi:hypothetical protein
MNWDYVAGFLDGEGTITISHRKRRSNKDEWTCKIIIFQKNPAILYVIQKFLEENGIKSRVRPTHTYWQWDKGYRRRHRLKKRVLSHYGLWIENYQYEIKFLENVVDKVYVKKTKTKEALEFLYTRPRIKGWRTLTPELVDEWVRLYESGLSTVQIAEKYSKNSTTIVRCLRKRGVSFRLKHVSEDEVKEWVRLYEQGYSGKKIGEMFHRPAVTVIRHLKAKGIPLSIIL